MPKTSFTLPLRGTVVDIIQHHSWLLVAATHSENINLGIQIVPLMKLANRASLEHYQLSTPKPIQFFVGLPTQPTQLTLDKQVLDASLVMAFLQNPLQVRSILDNASADMKLKRMSSHFGLSALTEGQEQTLMVLAALVQDDAQIAKLNEAFVTFQQQQVQQIHPQVLCVDEDGQGYVIPKMRVESVEGNAFDDTVPFSITDTIEFMTAYSKNQVLLVLNKVVEEQNVQEVAIYNVDSHKIEWTMAAPQVHEYDSQKDTFRLITALTADSESGMFALGFDDGLYLIFKPDSAQNALAFLRQELYDTQREILRKSPIHGQAITQLILSKSRTATTVDHLNVAAADLTMTYIKLSERIPRQRAKSATNGHSQNIRQFLQGPHYYFYSLSNDNTLRMWETDIDRSSVINIETTCATVALTYSEDKMGNIQLASHLIAGVQNSQKDSSFIQIRDIQRKLLNNPCISIQEEQAEGKVLEAVTGQFQGVWEYSQQLMKGKPEDRQKLLDFLPTLKDNLSVQLLMSFIKNEDNPDLIAKGLALLLQSNHPRLPVLFTQLMKVNRQATCMQVFEYLRHESIYGRESLYPMDLADQSQFLPVRQAALRGYAELAAKRDAHPDNVVYQTAYSRVLERLNDSADDIVDVAFALLFAQEKPLLPGVEGVLTAVAHPKMWIQKRGLDLLYTKDLLRNPESKGASLDLLRQVRDSQNEELRHKAFILSLTVEEGLQRYLRQLDQHIHTQLLDLERAKKEAELAEIHEGFELDMEVVDLFLSKVPEPNKEDKEVDQEEAEDILATLQMNMDTPLRRLQTFSYCTQTFPMKAAVKEFLTEARIAAESKVVPVTALTLAEENLLQEMALSYQPAIASLGAMALAKLGRVSALPILLLLTDEKDDLVRSRAVDGLLEFIHEPIVEQKLRYIVLQAPNEAIKSNSRDRASAIKDLVSSHSFKISHNLVSNIVSLIFEDGVYSHSERLMVRYLFESIEIEFTSNTRETLFKAIQDRAEKPKETNIRAKALRALFKQAKERGEDALRNLIRLTLDSPFEDVRVLGVVRVQESIDSLIQATPNWKDEWHLLEEEDWKSLKNHKKGGFVEHSVAQDISVNASLDPNMPVVGLPQPLLEDVQILNRVFYWNGHESLQEVFKTYCAHNLIAGDFIRTRRFLLSLPLEPIFEKLLAEILDNIQDSMIKGDPNITQWHPEMWKDYLNHPNISRAQQFYSEAQHRMRQPKTAEEIKAIKEGVVIPPYIPLEKAAYASVHFNIQKTAFSTIIANFNDSWVCAYIKESFDSKESSMRALAISKNALQILKHNGLLKESIQHLLQSSYAEMLAKGLNLCLEHPSFVDANMVDLWIARIKDVWSSYSFMNATLLHQYFVKESLFSLIPEPSLFGQDQEKIYFDLLRQIFVYQTEEELRPQVLEYEKAKDALTAKIQKLTQQINDLKAKTISSEEDTEAQKQLSIDLQSLRAEQHLLIKPQPTQDIRFFDVLKLLIVAKGAWVSEVLDQYMSTFDEKLSDEAFNIYFARGVRGGNAKEFLNSMVRNHHPRLDDIFAMLLSEKYGSIKDMQEVFFACTRLSRIDIVFTAFEKLADANLISAQAWQNLLKSPHRFLRYTALKHFLNKDEENSSIRQSTLQSIYKTFILEPKPTQAMLILSKEELDRGLQQKESGELHAFMKNGSSLTFAKMQDLRDLITVSPSFMRKLKASSMHCVASGLTWAEGIELQNACAQKDITIVLSRSNPLFSDATYTMWREILVDVLKYIHTECWEDDDALCGDLLKIQKIFQKDSQIASIRTLIFKAIGSVASNKYQSELEQIFDALLLEKASTLSEIVGTALLRCGNIHSLKYFYQLETSEFFYGLASVGQDSEHFLGQALLGAKNDDFQEQAVQIWLMQKVMLGGNGNILMSMLNASNDMKLLSAQLLPTLYDQQLLWNRVVEVLKLNKVQLSTHLSAISFQKVDMWKHAMTEIKKVYTSHYRVSADEQFAPSFEDYLAAERAFNTAQADLTQNRYNKDKVATCQSEYDKALKHQQKLNAVRHLTMDEWKWLSQQLSISNSRIRYMVAQFLNQDVLPGRVNRFEMLQTIEHIKEVIARCTTSFASFETFELNGQPVTQASSVSFGFGTLAGLIRNHSNVSVSHRRKALVSVIQLAMKENIPTISALLSIALNDPTQTIREEAFTLALLHAKELQLTWDGVIQQSINSVALRNAQASSQGSSRFDSLNQLIVSEIQESGKIEMLLHSIEKHTHRLAVVALEFLLSGDVGDISYEILALQAALKSSNLVIQDRLVNVIIKHLQKTQAHNTWMKSQEEAQINIEISYKDDAPFWDLLEGCLGHGQPTIRNAAANYLIQHDKHSVVPFVYREWLESYEASIQHQACTALEKLLPAGATAKVLNRVLHDPTETASVSRLGKTLLVLNEYSDDLGEMLISGIPSFTESSERTTLLYNLLMKFTGFVSEKVDLETHTYRIELFYRTMQGFLKNSLFDRLHQNLQLMLKHRVEVSGALDGLLLQLAKLPARANTLRVREAALNVCIQRYKEMTPKLSDVPFDDQEKTPVLEAKWEGSDWSALRNALDLNLEFHPEPLKRKEYLSTFQKKSAFAIMFCQGYSFDAFKILRKVLSDPQYALTERIDALDLLFVTRSIELQATIIRLVGLTSQGAPINEAQHLQQVPEALYHKALTLIGHYHYTDRGSDIFYHLLHVYENDQRKPYVFQSLWFFKDVSEYQLALLEKLLSVSKILTQSWAKADVVLPKSSQKGKVLHVWFELLWEMYHALFTGDVHPTQKGLQQQTKEMILSMMFAIDCNRIYAFYLEHCVSDNLENIDRDLQFYSDLVHLVFLNEDLRKQLMARITKLSSTEMKIAFLKQSISRRQRQIYVLQQYKDATNQALAKRQKRLDNDKSEAPVLEFIKTDLEPLWTLLDDSLIGMQVFFETLKTLPHPISDSAKEYVVSLFHMRKIGGFFIFNEDIWNGIAYLDWQVDVDYWEVQVSSEVAEVKFYFDLLEKEVVNKGPMLESVLDMIEHRKFEPKDRQFLFNILRNTRLEWLDLQVDKSKGKNVDAQITRVENYWLEALDLVEYLQMEGEELTFLLEHYTHHLPNQLRQKGVELYLKNHPFDGDQQLLGLVMQNCHWLRGIVYQGLQVSNLVALAKESAKDLPGLKMIFSAIISQMQKSLKDAQRVKSFVSQVFQSNIVNREYEGIAALQQVLNTGTSEEFSRFIKQRQNRQILEEAIIFEIMLDIVPKGSSLVNMFLVQYAGGALLYKVSQTLKEENIAIENHWIEYVLSGAQDEHIAAQAVSNPSQYAHRQYVNQLQRSRSSRFMTKENK